MENCGCVVSGRATLGGRHTGGTPAQRPTLPGGRKVPPYALLALFAALLPALPAAQQPRAEITAARLLPDAAVVSPNATVFQWPIVIDLGAQFKVRYDGPDAARASLLATVRTQGGDVIAKRKESYELQPGLSELSIGKLLATTDVLGRRMLTLRLELAVKGAPTVARELEFTVSGPEAPTAAITALKLYDPRGATTQLTSAFESKTQFGVGDSFGIEAIFELGENPAGLRPRLHIMAVVDEDALDTGPEVPRQFYTLHYDELRVDPLDVPQRVRATARLPYFFREPWNHRHLFTVYVSLDFGGPAVTAQVGGEVFDYRPGDERRNDQIEQRLISVARGPTWIVGAAHMPDPTGGLYQPPW